MLSHTAQAIAEMQQERDEARAVAKLLYDQTDKVVDVTLKLKTIRYLFFKAVMDDGTDTELNSAAHFVIDVMEELVSKLRDINDKSWDIYKPVMESRHKETLSCR